MTEDNRSFREFYPELAQRHPVHYAFGHRFLPHYVHHNPYAFFSCLFRRDTEVRVIEPNRFIHSRWVMFEESAGLIQETADPMREDAVFRRVSDLSMSIHEISGMPAALIRMPTPEQPVEAFMVAAVLLASASQPKDWPRDVKARVLTLEAQYDGDPGQSGVGQVCEWTKQGEHKNSGMIGRVDRDAFLGLVSALLKDPEAPAVASYDPPKDDAPATITLTDEPDPVQRPSVTQEPEKPWWKIW